MISSSLTNLEHLAFGLFGFGLARLLRRPLLLVARLLLLLLLVLLLSTLLSSSPLSSLLLSTGFTGNREDLPSVQDV